MEKDNSTVLRMLANHVSYVMNEVDDVLKSVLGEDENSTIMLDGFKSWFYESFYDYNGTKYNFVGLKKDGCNVSILGNPVVNGEVITNNVIEVKHYNYDSMYLFAFVLAYREYLDYKKTSPKKGEDNNAEETEKQDD